LPRISLNYWMTSALGLSPIRPNGDAEAQLAQTTVEFVAALIGRKSALIEGIERRALAHVGPLPPSSAAALRAEAARLESEAEALDAMPAEDDRRVARAIELRDGHRLSLELDALLTRRAELQLRLRLLRCKDALDTRHISNFATRAVPAVNYLDPYAGASATASTMTGSAQAMSSIRTGERHFCLCLMIFLAPTQLDSPERPSVTRMVNGLTSIIFIRAVHRGRQSTKWPTKVAVLIKTLQENASSRREKDRVRCCLCF
jgi:hypothetical protein